ncbi:MAG: glycosyltransferase family 1 protein [Hyphomicrobiaceae bacterium]|nr:glycosyltransferase family 1 protein [Hyphomicrobiaceae bacterium]MCC0025227.1 glycosyltransferase family 1 protein [Hyphomicrobiaceae bacterium]
MQRRVSFLTLGTRGDVQPYLALAVRLKAEGFAVNFGATEEFKNFVESNGVEYFNIGGSIESFLREADFERAMSESLLANAPTLLQRGQQIVEEAGWRSWREVQKADILLMNMNVSFGIDYAEALGIPAVMMALQPLDMTAEFPFCAYDGPDFGRTFNRISHVVTALQQAYYDFPRNRLRRKLLGLKSRAKGGFFKDSQGRHLPTLYAYSPHVSAKPADWHNKTYVTGYWQLEDRSSWTPPAELQAFLQAGKKPVYIGFGSMPFGAERNTKILIDALRKWGGRAIVGRGWGGINIDELPDTVFPVENAPHDKLFEHVSAVVHHGGAGTTSAGLHKGLPTMIVPQTVDQPFWGKRVYDLGCGPEPVKIKKLTADLLASRLIDLENNPSYRKTAEALAQRLAQEDGPGNAIKIINRLLPKEDPLPGEDDAAVLYSQ